MNITDLLSPPSPGDQLKEDHAKPIHEDNLMLVWEQQLHQGGFRLKASGERNTLTDAILAPALETSSPLIKETPIHIKVIGRHTNGSFRCHIGTGKASRPITSCELSQQMRLLAVFFRAEHSKSHWISPDFLFFPTWLLHLFRYTQHDKSPGRTDVRFLEDAAFAKEDHIYRLNQVLNSLFKFNLRQFNLRQFWHSVSLANYLFDHLGLDASCPLSSPPPPLYSDLISLLHAPRPRKSKPMCHNCNTKVASRRRLCVACYRYQLKHNEPRPLRLIVANRPGPRPLTMIATTCTDSSSPSPPSPKKHCANCGTHETHQWYRNLCGRGHWCETCKSYYLRHNKARPPELFLKAAKRKVDVRSLLTWVDGKSKNDSTPVDQLTATIASSSPSLLTVPSGCRPHLYHPRHYPPPSSSSTSRCTSPSSISSPSTPPPPPPCDYLVLNKHHSLRDQDYDTPIFHCL
ncbi:hypothetical protein [Absidia glauca]|uniref:GATA-type domain-containing protein n=1 Tax=Absidia glauca TaxID=4829 RepID=A0A163JY80_ABSGL|nr:hypothetical protein [Absidia glauca]